MAISELLATEGGMRPRLRWSSTPAGVVQAVVMHALHLQRASREAFILCDIQGCSITEAAYILGIGPEVVIRRLKRARRRMEDVVTRLCEHPIWPDSVGEKC